MNDSNSPLPFPPPGRGEPKILKDIRLKISDLLWDDMTAMEGPLKDSIKKMKSEHILIIDDEPQFRYRIANALEQAGYKTSEAVSGEDAFKILNSKKTARFDLLLIDIQMPGLSGIELIDKLKDDGIYLPMIAMSGLGGKGLITELLHKGCADFFYKPVESSELVKRVGHILNKKCITS